MQDPVALFEQCDLTENFDIAINWCKSFHLLEKLTDNLAVPRLVNRLTRSGVTVDKDLLNEGRKSGLISQCFVCCNCNVYMHYAWCEHAASHAYKNKIITSYPRDLDPTKTGDKKRGRPAGAVPGQPFGTK